MVSRAAVVIGVNKTGGLTPLRAAVSGARQVEAWLKAEGFDVTCLTDEAGPVIAKDVKDAVKKYVDLGTIEQLVLYFAGHGYLNGTAEIWLLSGAPDDPNEAIDQTVSAEFARSCGVPSVVFISDACRSNPPSLLGGRVAGSSAFPNRADSQIDVEVDRFFAAKPGDPALELSVDEARQLYAGLFTEMLRQVHRDPDPGLTLTISVNGENAVVVPCRRLKEVLPDLVDEAAQRRSITLKQKPQLRLESGEKTFIARAEFTNTVRAPSPSPPLFRLRNFRFGSARARRPAAAPVAEPADEMATLRSSPGFLEAVAKVRQADSTDHFETQAGIQVTGAKVSWAYASGGQAEAEPLPMHDERPVLIRLHGKRRLDLLDEPVSVLVQFGDGTGTVLAGLPGYIAAVTVDGGHVVNVSYVPSTNSPFWRDYENDKEHVEDLRAQAAVAARNGVLAVGRDDARRFGDSIRIAKRFDPTLGLYAALAYADVGLRKETRSVLEYMIRDLNAALFDVALLAGAMSSRSDRLPGDVGGQPIVPFCPMLSQTWSFLQPRGVELPPPLAQAGRRRLAALWTTFDADGMMLLRRLAEEGRKE